MAFRREPAQGFVIIRFYAEPPDSVARIGGDLLRVFKKCFGIEVPVGLHRTGEVRHWMRFNANARDAEFLALD